VQYRTWKAHTEQIALGQRARTTNSRHAPDSGDVLPVDDDLLDPRDPDDVGNMIALEVFEQVTSGNVSQAGAEAVLKIYEQRLGHFLPSEVLLPSSWYKCHQAGIGPTEAKYSVHDLCKKCDYVFPEETPFTAKCPDCETMMHLEGQRRRQVVYFDLADMVSRLYSTPYTARSVRYGAEVPLSEEPMATRELRDIYDGTIFHEVMEEHNLDR